MHRGVQIIDDLATNPRLGYYELDRYLGVPSIPTDHLQERCVRRKRFELTGLDERQKELAEPIHRLVHTLKADPQLTTGAWITLETLGSVAKEKFVATFDRIDTIS